MGFGIKNGIKCWQCFLPRFPFVDTLSFTVLIMETLHPELGLMDGQSITLIPQL